MKLIEEAHLTSWLIVKYDQKIITASKYETLYFTAEIMYSVGMHFFNRFMANPSEKTNSIFVGKTCGLCERVLEITWEIKRPLSEIFQYDT